MPGRIRTNRHRCGLVLGATALTFASVASATSTATASVAPPPVTIDHINGFFYPNPNDSGAFDASQLGSLVFAQQFPTIDFNPPTSAQVACTNATGVDENTRPFTDLVQFDDGTCGGVVAQGNGEQAGVGDLNTFQAVFSADLTVSEPGQTTFNFFSDDGWMLGLGPDQATGTQQPSYSFGAYSGVPASGTTPVYGYQVVGAFNQPTAPVQETVTVNFPAAGTYPLELDYTECCGGQLALTLGTTFGNPIPPPILPPPSNCPPPLNPVVSPATTPPSVAPAPLPALPLHTSATSNGHRQFPGRWILDQHGTRFKLASVNWSGAEQLDYVPAGLDQQPLGTIVDEIRAAGFNSVRLPWSNEMLHASDRGTVVCESAVAANPGLFGKTPIQVLDAVVDALANEGIVTILDNHSTDAMFCCPDDSNTHWYSGAYTQNSTADWVADWTEMAGRYSPYGAHPQPAVVAADLRNEPRGTTTWGQHTAGSSDTSGCATPGDPADDWRAAAEQGGDAVLAANPQLLVAVEGLQNAQDLRCVGSAPIQLSFPDGSSAVHQLIYSAHDYSFFQSESNPGSLFNLLGDEWGYILKQNTGYTAPVWVGEFGTCHTENTCESSPSSRDNGRWFSAFVQYLGKADVDWSYWVLNGTHPRNNSADHPSGKEEPYGYLNPTWSGPAQCELTAALTLLEPMTQGPGATAVWQNQPAPCLTASPPSLNFSGQQTSVAFATTFTNDTPNLRPINQVTVASPYTIDQDDCSGQTLSPGDVCSIAVRGDGSAPDLHFPRELTVDSGDPRGPENVLLTP